VTTGSSRIEDPHSKKGLKMTFERRDTVKLGLEPSEEPSLHFFLWPSVS
jgi:hypothetical protein